MEPEGWSGEGGENKRQGREIWRSSVVEPAVPGSAR